MHNWRKRILAFFLFCLVWSVGIYLRFYGGSGEITNRWVHPDENRMAIACGDISINCLLNELACEDSLYTCFLELVKGNKVTYQCFQHLNPHFFAYGSFPIYMYAFTREAMIRLPHKYEWLRFIRREYTSVYQVGRSYSKLAACFTILLVYLIGASAWGRLAGLLGALFLSLTVLHIQLAHFMTVDVILAFILTLTLHRMMKVLDKGRARDYLLLGIIWGVALATKLNAVLLGPIFVLAHLGYLFRNNLLFSLRSWRKWVLAGLMVPVMGVTFFICEPFAYFDYRTFSFELREESKKVQGEATPVFMIQYQNTPRYLYQVRHMINWTYGIPLGLLVFFGLAYCSYDIIQRFKYPKLLPYFWGALYFVMVANLQVKWLRHMSPFLPMGCVMAGAAVAGAFYFSRHTWLKAMIVTATALTVAFSFWYAMAFISMYDDLNPRQKASYWIYQNIEPGKNLLIEHWDESLPIALPGYRINDYPRHTLRPYDGASPRKVRHFAEELAWGDYILLNSKRLYGATMRVPDRYPYMNTYYRLLFTGELGYELKQIITTYPSWLGYEIVDDLADESFTVYEHPKAMIFEDTAQLTEDEIYDKIMAYEEPLTEPSYKEMILWGSLGEDEPYLRISDFVIRPKKPEPTYIPERPTPRPISRRPTPKPLPRGPRTMWAGGQGNDPGAFNEPRDITKDSNGFYYVADFRNYRIQKFDSEGKFVKMWGQEGGEQGQFKDPSGITMTPDGQVLVVDTWNQRLQMFTTEGDFIVALAPEQHRPFAPTDAAYDSQGNLYFSDTGNKRLQKYDKEGNFVMFFQEAPDTPDGTTNQVMGITVDSQDEIYVAAVTHRMILVFNNDGEYLRSWKIPTKDDKRPQIYLALGPEDTIYCSDTSNFSIYIFDRLGKMLGAFDGQGFLSSQMGLCVEDNGDAIVVDTWHHRVVRIQRERFGMTEAKTTEMEGRSP